MAAEVRNVANMVADVRLKTFHVPWDLHPLSLHAEFSHNTDLLAVHGHASADGGALSVPTDGEVGLHASSPIGLGGCFCADVLHDGTMLEVVGRLCLPHDRASTINEKAAFADRLRTVDAGREVHLRRKAEAARWLFDGPCHFGVRPVNAGEDRGGEPTWANGTSRCHLHLQYRGPSGLGVTTVVEPNGDVLVTALRPDAARACPTLRVNETVIVAVNRTMLEGRRVEDAIDILAECHELTVRSRAVQGQAATRASTQAAEDRAPTRTPSGAAPAVSRSDIAASGFTASTVAIDDGAARRSATAARASSSAPTGVQSEGRLPHALPLPVREAIAPSALTNTQPYAVVAILFGLVFLRRRNALRCSPRRDVR